MLQYIVAFFVAILVLLGLFFQGKKIMTLNRKIQNGNLTTQEDINTFVEQGSRLQAMNAYMDVYKVDIRQARKKIEELMRLNKSDDYDLS